MRLAAWCLLASAPSVIGPEDGRVEVQAPARLAPGARGEISVTILERPASELPILVRLHGPGIELGSTRLEWSDVVDRAADRPRLRTTMRASATSGTYPLTITVAYSICDQRHCLPRFRTLEAVVRVATPSAPAPGSSAQVPPPSSPS